MAEETSGELKKHSGTADSGRSDGHPFRKLIQSEDVLRQLLGEPSEVVRRKSIPELDEYCRRFIAKSPLLFVATADGEGRCDVSPRGDAPGSVLVIDDRHLLIPERPGNRRMDSLRNILANPHLGLIFLIPGLEETLRINGSAMIVQDEELLSGLAAGGRVPQLGIGVQVEECYIHCAKAFKRSQTWQPEAWTAAGDRPNIPRMIAAHVNAAEFTEEVIARGLQDSYAKRLY